MFIKISWYL